MANNLVTREHVTRMQEYFFSDDFVPGVATVAAAAGSRDAKFSEFANAQRRLQLRALVLFLGRLVGVPELDELLKIRLVDVQIMRADTNAPQHADGLDPSPSTATDRGEGTHRLLLLKSGPDSNDKIILFTAMEHRMPNECCLNALGDLFLYEEHRERPFNDTSAVAWYSDHTDPSPFLFHSPGKPYTPLQQSDVQGAIESALRFVKAPIPLVALIAISNVEFMVQSGADRHEAKTRTLAPPPPPHLSPLQVRLVRAKNFLESLRDLYRTTIESGAWKLQCFEERWPLSSLECMQRRDVKKHFRHALRRVNEMDGCTSCGRKETADGQPLLKCTKCRTQLYCSRECQLSDWKRHKKEDCKTILRPVKK